MAAFYVDYNGSTLGFGAFGGKIVNNTNNLPVTQSPTGQTAVSNAVNGSFANTYSFGSPSTNANTSPGTITINLTGTFNANGLLYQNLTGDQTVVTTAAGTYTLGGTAPFIENTASGKFIISIPIQGTTNWEKRGSSTLQLNAVNTFSAGMTIAAGTVEVGNASALGTSTVTMTGGKLSSSSTANYSISNNLSVSGTILYGDATNNGWLQLNGGLNVTDTTAMSVNSTSLPLDGPLQGSGALTLAGSTFYIRGPVNNTYSGAFTVSSGTLFLAGFNSGTPNQLNNASSITLNATTQICGNTTNTFPSTQTFAGTADLYIRNTSSSGIVFNNTNWTYTGSLRIYADNTEGTNLVQKVTFSRSNQFVFGNFYFYSGGGLTTLSQTLSYTGTTNLTYGGPLFLLPQSGTTTSIYSNDSSNNSSMTNTNVIQHLSSLAATLQLASVGGNISLTKAIQQISSGVLSVVKTGNKEVTLAPQAGEPSTFTGVVQVTEGTLNANSATALGSTSGGGISVASGATLSLGAAPTYSSRSLTISGTGSASAPNNGALVIANTGTSVFQSIVLGATGTYIRATNSGSINAPFTSNNNSIIFGASSGSDFVPFASLSNVFSGSGSVTYGGHSLDTGIVRADVRHTYTGNTTLAFGATYINASLELPGTGGPLGNKSLTAANTLLMTGGTLTYLSGNTDYSGRFSTAGSQQWKIDAYGQTVTFATALVGASSLALSDTSTGGSLTLSSASSTFSGGVTITSGTLFAGAAQSGVSGPLGITGTITFAPAGSGVLAYTSASASFDYSSRFATTNGQTRRINVNGQSVTFSAALGGTNALALVGAAGTLTLAVANTYTQGTTLSVGTLKCGNVASLGTGGLVQANNTTLHASAANGRLTIQGAHMNTGSGSRIIRIGAT